MAKSSQDPTTKNSLCKHVGHDWMTTTSAHWRLCKRDHCRASERLVDGQWISNARAYRVHDPVVASRRRAQQPRQASMWESEQDSTQERM